MRWYKATCLKEIYWKGKIFRMYDKIKVASDDIEILRNAGVIGDIKKINDVEFAVKKAPENAKRTYKKRKG